MSLKLKSTLETVYALPWTGNGKAPWKEGYTRILKPQPGLKNGNQAISLIVRSDSLLTS